MVLEGALGAFEVFDAVILGDVADSLLALRDEDLEDGDVAVGGPCSCASWAVGGEVETRGNLEITRQILTQRRASAAVSAAK